MTVPKLKEQKNLKHTEAAKLCGDLWGKLSEAEKQPFIDLANKDKERYEKQLKELQTKGYFIMQDGTKSSDVPMTGKKRKIGEEKTAKKATSKNEVKAKGKAKGKAKKDSDEEMDSENDDTD